MLQIERRQHLRAEPGAARERRQPAGVHRQLPDAAGERDQGNARPLFLGDLQRARGHGAEGLGDAQDHAGGDPEDGELAGGGDPHRRSGGARDQRLADVRLLLEPSAARATGTRTARCARRAASRTAPSTSTRSTTTTATNRRTSDTALSPFGHPATYWGLDKKLVIGEFYAVDHRRRADERPLHEPLQQRVQRRVGVAVQRRRHDAAEHADQMAVDADRDPERLQRAPGRRRRLQIGDSFRSPVRASEQQAPTRRSRCRSSGPGDRHRDLARQIGTGAGGAPVRRRRRNRRPRPRCHRPRRPPPRQRRTGRLTRPRPSARVEAAVARMNEAVLMAHLREVAQDRLRADDRDRTRGQQEVPRQPRRARARIRS